MFQDFKVDQMDLDSVGNSVSIKIEDDPNNPDVDSMLT